MMTVKQVMMCLPDPPEGHWHTVESISPQVMRVTLHHPDVYKYTSDPVVTVWGFIKNDNVYAAKSFTKLQKDIVCKAVDSWRLSGYTCFKPTITSLSDDNTHKRTS